MMFLFQDAAAAPQWLYDPRFWILAGGAAVAAIMWFARVEFKTSANAERQAEYEETRAEERKVEREEFRELKKAFYGHASDTKLHHNEEMFREFRQGIDRRFTGVESSIADMHSRTQQSLNDINRKLDHLADK